MGKSKELEGHSRLLHRATWLVLIAGLATSAIATVAARNVNNSNERRTLAQNATIAANEMASLADSARLSMENTLAVVAATNGSPTAFTRVTNTPSSFFNFWVVERSTRSGWVPLMTVKTSSGKAALTMNPTSADLAGEQAVITQLQREKGGSFRIMGFIGSGQSRQLAVGEKDAKSSYLVFADLAYPEQSVTSAASNEADFLGLHEQYALYTTGGQGLSAAVLASTSHLPLTGRRAVVILDPNSNQEVGSPQQGGGVGKLEAPPGDLMLVVSSNGWLSGAFSNAFPWILLVVTGLAALAMATAAEVILRRRDDALTMVVSLEAKNRDLDRALAEQAQAQQDRQEMEAQLRAAQRMEAVGNLAGGVAHDFNNLLAVILNYAQFAVEELDGHPVKQDLEEVVGAARRAADLTRQLLVFSRRDIVEARVVDLNQVVEGMQRLLTRTIGEDIALTTQLDPQLPLVRTDEGEIEQVLMNLAVNSRDAIEGSGGRLAVLTEKVELSEATARLHPDLPTGTYASLTVSDNGSGMSEDVLARAFDPFFTTKPVGQGTGLGLASVYGIVQRWGGDVQVKSREGKGTAVTILLPATTESAVSAPSKPLPAPRAANATVLVVEDQDAVRQVARRVLERAGHKVVEASNGAEALARGDLGEVDLLLTDVVMPGGMSGHDLGLELQRRCPTIRVLYMSGYTADIIARRGVLEDGISLLQKPFNAESLLHAVAAALEPVPEHVAG